MCAGVGTKKRGHSCARNLKPEPREPRRVSYRGPYLAALSKMQLSHTGMGCPVVGLPELKDAELEAAGWRGGRLQGCPGLEAQGNLTKIVE